MPAATVASRESTERAGFSDTSPPKVQNLRASANEAHTFYTFDPHMTDPAHSTSKNTCLNQRKHRTCVFLRSGLGKSAESARFRGYGLGERRTCGFQRAGFQTAGPERAGPQRQCRTCDYPSSCSARLSHSASSSSISPLVDLRSASIFESPSKSLWSAAARSASTFVSASRALASLRSSA